MPLSLHICSFQSRPPKPLLNKRIQQPKDVQATAFLDRESPSRVGRLYDHVPQTLNLLKDSLRFLRYVNFFRRTLMER
jgi:hypothetical protein